MTRSIPYSSILLKIALGTAAAIALALAPSPLWAQHGGGGGHFGGGHFGGRGHAAAPRMAAPPMHFAAPPPHVSPPPVRMAAPPAARAGTRGFGLTPQPSVHFSARPGEAHPVLGNHVAAPIMITPPHFANPSHFVPPPHTTIGFPPSEQELWKVNGGSALSFSGEGHEIWQNSPGSAARIRSTNTIAASRSTPALAGARPAGVNAGPEHRFPRRPVYPVHPIGPIFHGPVIFGAPIFGFGLGFGSPFFGFNGFYGGFNSLWGPSCGPYWAWGFGCNALPYYGYGYNDFGMYETPNYAPDEYSEQTQPETQPNYGPFVYEPPAGSSQRDLAELILKDGTVYNVTDYWLVGGELHFTTPNSDNNGTTEQVIDLDQLDMQKTVDINSQRGFRFVLRNAPIQEYLQEQDQQNPQENQEQPPQPEQPAPPPAPQEQPNPQM